MSRMIEGGRKRRGRSDSEHDERSDDKSLHAYMNSDLSARSLPNMVSEKSGGLSLSLSLDLDN